MKFVVRQSFEQAVQVNDALDGVGATVEAADGAPEITIGRNNLNYMYMRIGGSDAVVDFAQTTGVFGDYLGNPVATRLAKGVIVVVWSHRFNDATELLGRYVNEDGSFASDAFQLLGNDLLDNDSLNDLFFVKPLADGRFMVVGLDYADDQSSTLEGQIFNADGSAVGGVFSLGDDGMAVHAFAKYHTLPDGRFVVVFQEGAEYNNSTFTAQIFNSDGSKAGASFEFGAIGRAFGYYLTERPDGGFSVTSYGLNEDGNRIAKTFIQIFDADGQIQGSPVLMDGQYEIVEWTSDSDFVGRNYQFNDHSESNEPFDTDFSIVDSATARADLRGTTGDDELHNNGFGGTVYGRGGNDVLTGRDFDDDRLDGGLGHDRLNGLAGDDILTGGRGNDLLNGGKGEDVMTGGLGDDRYIVDDHIGQGGQSLGNDGDQVIELANGGFDTIIASGFDMYLDEAFNIEGATLWGSGDFNIAGNELDNRLRGNAGDNTIADGEGRDMLSGGGGADTFTFGGSNAIDAVVTDFTRGEDHLALNIATTTWHLSASGHHIVVESGDITILLRGVTALTAADFIG